MRFEKEDLRSAGRVCKQLLKASYFPLDYLLLKKKREIFKKRVKEGFLKALKHKKLCQVLFVVFINCVMYFLYYSGLKFF